jgi:hypothetical protein
VDSFGNYLPGFCGGISLGKAKDLNRMIEEGIELDRYPVLRFIVENDFAGFYQFAQRQGFRDRAEGYYSKCHLCLELRKFLCSVADFQELQPKVFYQQIAKK